MNSSYSFLRFAARGCQHHGQKNTECTSATYMFDGTDLHITMSIGLSTYPEDGEDAETLIGVPTPPCIRPKKSGRNNYQFFKKK